MGGGDLLARVPSDRSVAIGTATSVRDHLWRSAEIHPESISATYTLSDKQRSMLQLFT
jgi:hypothetical protein